MHTTCLGVFLLFISTAIASNEAPSDVSCRARAWVRAPDLEAGQVVQGHVRVKLDGSCERVSSYNLGLRFAERSLVKTRRAGVTLPENPFETRGPIRREPTKFSNNSIYENKHVGWHDWMAPEVDQSVLDQYNAEIENPELWLVREEERIGFETRYTLFDEMGREPEPDRDLIQLFSLLVPSTIYPPAFDKLGGGSIDPENIVGAEHVYMYFVEVNFSNGTRREIEAGYTSFNASVGLSRDISSNPREAPVSFKPMTMNSLDEESVNVTASTRRNKDPTDTEPRDTFTLEVKFPAGRYFEQGSKNNITIISHQVGPGLQRPLKFNQVFASANQLHTWAAKYGADNETAEKLLQCGPSYGFEIQPKLNDESGPYDDSMWRTEYPQFSQDGIIENGTMFSTEPVTLQFTVPRQTYPPFDMYYQKSEVELKIDILLRNLSESEQEPQIPDDEYDWTPKLRTLAWSKRSEVLRATVPISVYRKSERPPISSAVHYLSAEARAPTFVDPSTLPQLLQMTAEERDGLAPFAQPTFTSKSDGEVATGRYYGPNEWMIRPDLYYVGNTWLRKVLARGESGNIVSQGGKLVIQA